MRNFTRNLQLLTDISKTMDLFVKGDDKMYNIINRLGKSEIKRLINEYNAKTRKERVNKARRLILHQLLLGKRINDEVVNRIRLRVQTEAERNGYKKKIFLRWSNGRILFPLYYEKHDSFVKSFLTELAIEIRAKLNISNKTDYHIVTFDGAQHQGSANCWFALYNNSHKSQITAYQMMFSLWPELVNYGKYLYKTKGRENLTTENYKDVSISKILKIFNKYKSDIINDISPSINTRSSDKSKRGSGRKSADIINITDIFRKGTEPVMIKRKHSKIQNQLLEDLRKIYDNVEPEIDFIDIRVENDEKIILFEIKTYENPIKCIKEAIGQLLLYSFNLKNPQKKKVELRVIGPNKLSHSIPKFKEYIKENLNMDFDYLDLKLS